MDNAPPPLNILLVEDNPSDVEITRRALQKGRVKNQLTVARDGQEALDILFGRLGDVPLPDLILLDLNLPRVDGREVLEKIKADPELRHIPVVVISVSTREEDIARCYELGVKTFISKPARVEDFIVIATLPPVDEALESTDFCHEGRDSSGALGGRQTAGPARQVRDR